MKGNANYDDIQESGGFTLLPDGKYVFQIVELNEKYTSTNNDPMANIKLACLDPQYTNNTVWDNIILPNPGSPAEKIKGRTKRFLHAIGEPFQGNFEWDTDRWAYKKVEANIGQKDGNNGLMNFVKGYIVNDSLNPQRNNQNNSGTTNKQDQSQMPWYNKDLPF